jgi:hypothetical protein
LQYYKREGEYSGGWDRFGTELVFWRGVLGSDSRQPLRGQQRAQREEFVPARRASQRWQFQKATHYREQPWNFIRRDALQLQIAADAAARIAKVAKRDGPRVKTRFASWAAPWDYTYGTEQIFGNGSPS